MRSHGPNAMDNNMHKYITYIKLGFGNIINVMKHILNTYYTGTLAGTRNSMIASHETGFSFSSSVPKC